MGSLHALRRAVRIARASVARFDCAELQRRQREVVQERDVFAERDGLDHVDVGGRESEQTCELRGGQVQRLSTRFEAGGMVRDLEGIRGEDCGRMKGGESCSGAQKVVIRLV